MSYEAKLKWAQVHLETLYASVDEFIRQKPYKFTDDYDANTREYRVRVERTKDFPSEWPLWLGDALYNLRSSLDHIVYAIARKADSSIDHTSVEFPIVRTFDDFEGNKARNIQVAKGVRALMRVPIPVAAMDAIRDLQPYQGRYGDDGSHTHPLWRLHHLNRVDKHRHFLLHGTRALSMSVSNPPHLNITEFGIGVPFVEGAVVFRATVDSAFDGKPDVRPHFRPTIALAEKGLGENLFIRDTLDEIHDHIRDVVIPKLKTFLV